MADIKRLFNSGDMAGAILYAKRLAGDSEDAYPLIVDTNGALMISGSIQVAASGTETTITNAASNPVPVTGNINVATITIGTVTLSSTATTISNAEVNPVHVALPEGSTDSFGHIVTAEINNDIDVQFYRATSDSNLSNIITETETSGGTCSRSDGMATFAATTTGGSRAKGVSLIPVVYTAGAEVYAIFTAAFPTATGGTGSYRRIGLYNDLTDGLFIGYETTDTFGLSIVKGGVQTTTLKANFSADTLVGGAGSKFTRNGTPEAIDLTKLNVFKIRFGWVGSAPLKFEVLSPDGNWVLFHTILQPNLAAVPSLNTADLSFTCDVAAGTSGNAQSILSNCWGAGTTQKLRKLSDTLNVNTLAELSRSVITAYSTAGGGEFVNVKADPSGALNVSATLSTTASTITNAVGNPVNVALTSTVVTVKSAVAGFNVNIATATLGTVTISGTVTLSSTAGTVTNTVSTIVNLNRTLSSSSGTLSATQVTLVLAGSNKTKVHAFSLTTTSTTGVICAFHHGSQSGPELWRVLLQAPSGANSGANLAVSPPAHIFATPSAGNLILFLSSAVRVDFSVGWFDEA